MTTKKRLRIPIALFLCTLATSVVTGVTNIINVNSVDAATQATVNFLDENGNPLKTAYQDSNYLTKDANGGISTTSSNFLTIGEYSLIESSIPDNSSTSKVVNYQYTKSSVGTAADASADAAKDVTKYSQGCGATVPHPYEFAASGLSALPVMHISMNTLLRGIIMLELWHQCV